MGCIYIWLQGIYIDCKPYSSLRKLFSMGTVVDWPMQKLNPIDSTTFEEAKCFYVQDKTNIILFFLVY